MSGVSSPRALRPDEVRRQDFTVRFRGLDPNEVRGFLNALADDLARLYEEVTALTEDNGRLRDQLQEARGELQRAQGDLQQAHGDPQGQVTDQAVLLLNQAQQLADALIDEGMQSARDLLMAARHQQRDIIEPGYETVQGAVVETIPPAEQLLRQDGSSSPDVEDVRMFAKVAQVQFRAVLDALDEQVNRLGQFSETAERAKPADDQDWPPSTNPRRSELNPRPIW
jgi:cell division initiation protein